MTNQANNQAEKADQAALPEENQVVDYLISNPDFFLSHLPLLNDLEIPHEAGGAVSLVERQVSVLREKNQHFEEKLREMVDAVHDNQRLHLSLHRLAVNLLGADSLDDVLAIVDDELRHKLGTDYVHFRLSSENALVESSDSQSYVPADDEVLQDFASNIDNNRIQCGQLSNQQISALFMDDASEVGSSAVIPVADAGIRGLIVLGSADEHRYHPGMGTDFLTRLADLISAAMRSQLAE